MNKVILMGRLTADPELRQTPQGTPLARFSIAVNRRYQREGSQQADFIDCVAWRQTGEFISRYFRKGSMIAVDGQLQSRSWDGQDGKRQYATEVLVENAYFTGSKAESGTGSNPNNSYGSNGGSYQSNFGGYQQPSEPSYNSAPQSDPAPQANNGGYVELGFADDMGSEDDLPF